MKKYFISKEKYDLETIKKICNEEDVKGVVLGDYFCQKRMFDNGIVDMILFMNYVLSSEKTVIYQAPLYVTGRCIEEVKSILTMMNNCGKKSYVIVQDFGTAQLVSRDYQNIGLIWGQLGRVRELRYSDDFLRFLVEKTFVGMETGDVGFSKRLCDFGLTPYFNNALIKYDTLGRTCYFVNQIGECDRNGCTEGGYCLQAQNTDYKMTIDGYMLGKKYLPSSAASIETVSENEKAELIVRI